MTAVGGAGRRAGPDRGLRLHDGLAAAGWITLAATLTRYADRADQILATTIYPAIVRVRDRGDVLEELFAKANRLTLMWAFPFGAGLALFGADLVVFVLGDEWRGAIVLLGGLAIAVALQQVGYSWFAFYRARGESWPQAVECAVFGAAFVVLAVPGALLGGSWGFVAGRLAAAVLLAVRGAYVRRLLPGVGCGHGAPTLVPVALATAPVLGCGSRCGAGGARSPRRSASSRCGSPSTRSPRCAASARSWTSCSGRCGGGLSRWRWCGER